MSTLEPGKLTLDIDRKNRAVALGMPSHESVIDCDTRHHHHAGTFYIRRRGVEAKLVLGAAATEATFVDPI